VGLVSVAMMAPNVSMTLVESSSFENAWVGILGGWRDDMRGWRLESSKPHCWVESTGMVQWKPAGTISFAGTNIIGSIVIIRTLIIISQQIRGNNTIGDQYSTCTMFGILPLHVMNNLCNFLLHISTFTIKHTFFPDAHSMQIMIALPDPSFPLRCSSHHPTNSEHKHLMHSCYASKSQLHPPCLQGLGHPMNTKSIQVYLYFYP